MICESVASSHPGSAAWQCGAIYANSHLPASSNFYAMHKSYSNVSGRGNCNANKARKTFLEILEIFGILEIL
jgi:hypothetical protein